LLSALVVNSQQPSPVARATADLGLFLPPMTLNIAKSSESRPKRKINERWGPSLGYSEQKLLRWRALDHCHSGDKLNFVSPPQQHHGFAAHDATNDEIK
jgi:hypothetical protein